MFWVAEFLYAITLVRLITLRSAIFARLVKISSWTPSAKNAFSWFALMLVKGRTAMLLSGITGAANVGDFAARVLADVKAERYEKMRAPATTVAATISNPTNSGLGFMLDPETGRESFLCLPDLNLIGSSGLPSSLVWRFTTWSRTPCFTSHSPNSSK